MEHPVERKRSPSRALIIFLLSLWMQRRERSEATQKGWGVHDLSYPDRPRLGMIIDAFLRSVRRSRSDWYRAPSRQVGEESEILLSARCSSSLPRLALLLRLQALSVGDEAKAQESRDLLLLKVDTLYFCYFVDPLPSPDGIEEKRPIPIMKRKECWKFTGWLSQTTDKCLFSGLLSFGIRLLTFHADVLSICPYVRAQISRRGCTEKMLWSLRTSKCVKP